MQLSNIECIANIVKSFIPQNIRIVSFSLPFDHVAMHREDEEDETSLLFEAMLLLDKVVSSADGAKAKECLTAMAAAKIKKKK